MIHFCNVLSSIFSLRCFFVCQSLKHWFHASFGWIEHFIDNNRGEKKTKTTPKLNHTISLKTIRFTRIIYTVSYGWLPSLNEAEWDEKLVRKCQTKLSEEKKLVLFFVCVSLLCVEYRFHVLLKLQCWSRRCDYVYATAQTDWLVAEWITVVFLLLFIFLQLLCVVVPFVCMRVAEIEWFYACFLPTTGVRFNS